MGAETALAAFAMMNGGGSGGVSKDYVDQQVATKASIDDTVASDTTTYSSNKITNTFFVPYANAGAHNSIYRGKNLGTAVTAEQWAAIKAGTFDDMYIGDYWIINGITWRIAAFDFYYKAGDIACNYHHIILVPDESLYTHVMNNSDTTTGGYAGSKINTEGLVQALSLVEAAFGAEHILERRELLCNAVTDGKPSGGAWYSLKICLMNEVNVYGCKMFSAVSDGSVVPENFTTDKLQYPLFAQNPCLLALQRQGFWLRDVVSEKEYASVGYAGYATSGNASSSNGVRPEFAIYQT